MLSSEAATVIFFYLFRAVTYVALAVKDQHGRLKSCQKASDLPVWYSYDCQWGAFKHAVLYIDGWKHELRLDRYTGLPIYSAAREALPEHVKLSPQYVSSIGHNNFKLDRHKYRYRFVGTTSLPTATVGELCQDLIKNFGRYNLAFNNCQHFAKAIADIIIAKEDRAYDFKVLSVGLKRRAGAPAWQGAASSS